MKPWRPERAIEPSRGRKLKNSRGGRQRRSWCCADEFETPEAFGRATGVLIVWNNPTFQAATKAAEEQMRWEREEEKRQAAQRRKEEKRREKEV